MKAFRVAALTASVCLWLSFGCAAQNLHLFDSRGQDLGVFINIDLADHSINQQSSYETYRTIVPAQQVIVDYAVVQDSQGSVSVTPVDNNPVLFFELPNCTGRAYGFIGTPPLSTNAKPYILFALPGPVYLTQTGIVNPAVQYQSTYDPPALAGVGCQNATGTQPGMLLRQVKMPFTQPIAWPLTVKAIATQNSQ